jgi:23S rRNA (uracil1939-C5)-methyltransferase
VFVPRAAPGEQVELKPKSLKLHRNFARAEVGAIVAGAAARVAPACPHYERDHCGGCQLQHLAYDAQLAAKRAIVGDALRRIGKFAIADPEIVEAVDEWRYAAQITLAVARSRGAAGGATLGLHPYDRPNGVFPLADCHITDHRLMELWRELRPHLELLPPRLERLTLRLDREGRRHVIAEAAGEPWLDAERVRAAVSDGATVICWWKPVDGAARVVAGPATGFPATALERLNPEMDRLARQWAVEQLGDVRRQAVWDLYGGIGDTAALLAERGAQVVSVDADEAAIDWARRRDMPAAVRFVAARAEDILPTLPPPQAVVVQPPRAGLHWNVTLRLTGEPVPHLSYVSCDPATLARDLNRLAAVYRLVAVRAFDVSPQTAGVETVAVLEAA